MGHFLGPWVLWCRGPPPVGEQGAQACFGRNCHPGSIATSQQHVGHPASRPVAPLGKPRACFWKFEFGSSTHMSMSQEVGSGLGPRKGFLKQGLLFTPWGWCAHLVRGRVG